MDDPNAKPKSVVEYARANPTPPEPEPTPETLPAGAPSLPSEPQPWGEMFQYENWLWQNELIGMKAVGMNQAQPVGNAYWANPQRIARYRSALKALPPGAQAPEFLNPDAIEAAYQWMAARNPGKSWYQWELAPDDPINDLLGQMQPPPVDFVPEYEADEVMQAQQKAAEQQNAATAGTFGIPDAEWNKLEGWKKVLIPILSSGAKSGAMMGAIGGLEGGLAGAATGAVMGTGLGYAAEKSGVVNSALMALDIPAEAVERVTGMLAQAGGAILDPDTYGGLNELLSDLPAAWQAAHLAQDAAAVQMANGRILNLGGEDTYLNQSQYGLDALTEARRRIAAGESMEKVSEDIQARFGFTGQLGEIAGHMLGDPLNLAGLGIAKGGEKIAQALSKGAKTAEQVRAFELLGKSFGAVVGAGKHKSGGLADALRMYGTVLHGEDINTVSKMDAVTRYFAGVKMVDGQPVMKALEAPQKRTGLGKIAGLFQMTPAARATEIVAHSVDNMRMLLAEESDPTRMAQYVNALAGTNPEAITEVAKVAQSVEGAVFPLALRDSAPKVNEMVQNMWMVPTDQRNVITKIADTLGIDPYKLVGEINDAKGADTYVTALKKRLTDLGGEAAQLASRLDMDGGALHEMVKPFVDGTWALSADEFKYKLIAQLGDDVEGWAVKHFDVTPDKLPFRFADTIKKAQSLVLLQINPTYALNNAINNAVTMAFGGVLGLNTQAQRNQFWKSFGAEPVRRRAGVGSAGEVNEFAGVKGTEYYPGRIIRDAQTPNGTLSKINGFFERTGDRIGFAGRIAQDIERWSSDVAYTEGTKRAWYNLHREGKGFDRMPAALEATMREMGVDPSAVYSAIRNGMNRAEIEANLWQHFADRTLDRVVTPEQAQTLREAGVYDDLARRLRTTKTDEQIRAAFRDTIDDANRKIEAKLLERLTYIAEREMNTVKGEGLQAAVKIYDDIYASYHDFWTRHNAEMDNLYRQADQIQDKRARRAFKSAKFAESNRAWRQMQTQMHAKMMGVIKALGGDAGQMSRYSEAITGEMVTFMSNWDAFFQERGRMWRTLFDAEDNPAALNDLRRMLTDVIGPRKVGEYEAQGNWGAAINEALDAAYLQHMGVDEAVTDRINMNFGELFDKQFSGKKAVESWRKGVQRINRLRAEANRYFRRGDAAGLLGLGEEGAQVKAAIDNILGGKRLNEVRDPNAAWEKFHTQIYNGLIARQMQHNQLSAGQIWRAATGQPEPAQKATGIATTQKKPAQVERVAQAAENAPEARPDAPVPLSAVDERTLNDYMTQNGYRHVNHLQNAVAKYLGKKTDEITWNDVLATTERRAAEKRKAGVVEGDRRVNEYLRAKIEDLPPEEYREIIRILRDEIMVDKTGLGSLKAYEVADPLPFQIALDISGLKSVNDTYAHTNGDRLIHAYAAVLQDLTQEAYHLHGDEFVLQANTLEEANALVERINGLVKRLVIEVEDTNGDTHWITGFDIHAGVGDSYQAADESIKAQRTAAGAARAAAGDAAAAADDAGKPRNAFGGTAAGEDRRLNNRVREIEPPGEDQGGMVERTLGGKAWRWYLSEERKMQAVEPSYGIYTREALARDIGEVFGRTPEETDALMKVFDGWSNYWAKRNGRLPEEFYATYFGAAQKGGAGKLRQNQELTAAAISRFGITDNPNEAGYILPNGEMLDFSGRSEAGYKKSGDRYVSNGDDYLQGKRYTDHRDISEILDGVPDDRVIDYFTSQTGAIRVDFNNGLIDTTGPITSAQIRMLRRHMGDDLRIDVYEPGSGKLIARYDVPDGKRLPSVLQKVNGYFEGRADLPESGALFQAAKGATDWLDDGRAVLHALEGADVSTVLHEVTHVWMRAIPDEDVKVLEGWLVQEGIRYTDDWVTNPGENVDAHERIARAMERYFADGVAPVKGLEKVFQDFKRWMVDIYRSITGSSIDVKISDEVRGLFDKWLSEVPDEAVPTVWDKMDEAADFALALEAPIRTDTHGKIQARSGLVDAAKRYLAEGGKIQYATNTKNYTIYSPDDIRIMNGEVQHRVNGQWMTVADSQLAQIGKRSSYNYEGFIERAYRATHEMTSAEWVEQTLARTESSHISQDRKIQLAKASHKAAVRHAIERGERIPDEILAEYPDLAKIVAAPEPARVGEVTGEDIARVAGVEPEPTRRGTFTADRAPKGGIIGMNGLFYPGGAFLPHTMLDKLTPSKRTGAPRKVEVQPYRFEFPLAENQQSIYKVLGGVLQYDRDSGLFSLEGVSRKTVEYFGGEETLKRLADAYNDGYRWFDYETGEMFKGTPEPARAGEVTGQRPLFQSAEPTDTPAFRAWFGDSKVVDESGQPLVVYHGTPNGGFEEFTWKPKKGQQLGFGIHFTEKPEYAGRYADNTAKIRSRGKAKNGQVYETYLSIRNPLYADAIVKEGSPEWELALNLANGRKNLLRYSGGRDEGGLYGVYLQRVIDGTNPERAHRIIRDAGYDGIRYEAEYSNAVYVGRMRSGVFERDKSWVVFDSTQIKSVNNRGTFDPNNPNILYQAAEPDAVAAPMGEVGKLHDAPYDEAYLEGYISTVVPTLRDAEAKMLSHQYDVQEGSFTDQVREGIRRQRPDVTPEELEQAVNEVTRQTKAYLGGVYGQMTSNKLAAKRWGEKARDMALLNYNRRTGMDNLANMIFPYQFWYTRSMMNWAVRIFNDPAILANYARIKEFQQNTVERPGFPTRLKGKMGIRLPFLPEWMGEGVFVDPMRQIYPFEQLAKPFEKMASQNNIQAKKAATLLQQWMAEESAGEEEVTQALTTQQGVLWDKAWAQAGNEMDKEIANPMDFMALMSGFSLPIQWAYQLAMGRKDKIGQLPPTRMIQAATGALGIGGPEGINLEAPLRKAVGLPEYDQYHDIAIDRMIAGMAAEGTVSPRDAQLAMIERSGPVYELAQRRMAKMGAAKYAFSPLSLDFFTEGEQMQRGLQAEWNVAIEAWKKGDKSAFNQFFEDHPEYEAQRAAWRDPEERLHKFLIDEVWDRYMALEPQQKYEVKRQLGPAFTDAFLDKETRSYESLSAETLAMWSQMMGGSAAGVDVPQMQMNPVEVDPMKEMMSNFSPTLARQWLGYTVAGQELSEGALKELGRLWEAVGKPEGDFNKWLKKTARK